MKTIKIIDLLNKIANGEEVPKKFQYEDMIFIYNDELGEHFDKKEGNSFNYTFDLTDTRVLNDEVEIIEDIPKENKKIEKLENLNTDYHMERRKYGALTNEEIVLDIQTLKNYINKLIDKKNGDNNE